MTKIGILLTNTGTPDAPNPRAVRQYLREFLSDQRVVPLPRLLWLPLLHGVILPFRSRHSAKLYQKIWTAEGSPLRTHMQKIADQLEENLTTQLQMTVTVEVGMNYGNPTIAHALKKLLQQEIEQLIVLPLYPQYSSATAASSFDRVARAFKKITTIPKLTFIRDYANFESYIKTLARSVANHWSQHGRNEHLLLSFHGLPERFIRNGDLYQQHCEQTATLLAQALNLTSDQWTVCYQSRFGKAKWLEPCTAELLTTLPKRGVKNVGIMCPGFAVDCLETLEEINIRGREIFLGAGGENLHYIPALNADAAHITMLQKLLMAEAL